MAFFKKDREDEVERDRILGQSFKEFRYSTLSELLTGVLDDGSKDGKRIEINFADERSFVILTSAGKLILARDSSRPVELSSFLYWSDLSEATKNSIGLLANGAPLSENVLASVATENPEALDTLKAAVRDSSLEAFIWLTQHMDSHQGITVDNYNQQPEIFKLLGSDGLSIAELGRLIELTENRRVELESILSIADVPFEFVTLTLTGNIIPETAEDRFVLAAAEAEATLADTWEISAGFRWKTILQKIQEFSKSDLLKLHIELPTEELPDDFQLFKSYEKLFHLTQHLGGELQAQVTEVFELSGDSELALKLARDNDVLEARILEVEDQLSRSLSKEEYETFEDLDDDLQASVRFLLLERREANIKRTLILERLSSLIVDELEVGPDDRLRSFIVDKLLGISGAIDFIPVLEEELNSDFHLIEDAPEFNFQDAIIEAREDGSFAMRGLTEEEAAAPEEVLSMEEFVSIAAQVELELAPVDLVALEEHLKILEKHTRRSVAGRSSSLYEAIELASQ